MLSNTVRGDPDKEASEVGNLYKLACGSHRASTALVSTSFTPSGVKVSVKGVIENAKRCCSGMDRHTGTVMTYGDELDEPPLL